MTDIKLPPFPEGLREDIEDYAREAVRLNAQGVPDEPNWRHPKIQGLIGSEARLRITVDLIWRILEDPNQEFTASDMEYWDTVHDKLKEALSTKPAAPQPAEPVEVPSDDLAHEIWAVAQLAPGEGIVDGAARVEALLRKVAHPAITHCDNCGCDWLDNGLNPVGCPYCKLAEQDVLLRQALKALERGAWDTLRGRNAAEAIRNHLGVKND